jgi:hypothetical protein
MQGGYEGVTRRSCDGSGERMQGCMLFAVHDIWVQMLPRPTDGQILSHIRHAVPFQSMCPCIFEPCPSIAPAPPCAPPTALGQQLLLRLLRLADGGLLRQGTLVLVGEHLRGGGVGGGWGVCGCGVCGCGCVGVGCVGVGVWVWVCGCGCVGVWVCVGGVWGGGMRGRQPPRSCMVSPAVAGFP